MSSLVLARRRSAGATASGPRGAAPGNAGRSAEGVPHFLQGRAVSVSQPTDATEVHADRVADRVLSSAPCPACSAGLPCARCGADVERGAEGSAPPLAQTPTLDHGRPLDRETRQFFEPRFRRDLGGVRIHAGEHDGALARSFAARAFTTGEDIVFAPGEYAPGTDSGRRLIAHELAHVVQPTPAGRIARQPDAGVAGGMDAGATGAGPADAGPAALPGGVPPPAPTPMFDSLFGACATPEEGVRRDAFAVRTFHLDRNSPSTTLGRFDADYFPFIGLMPVTVKIRFKFVSADNTPGFWELIARHSAGEDIRRFFWTDTEKADFKSEFISRVVARWSARFTMRSTKPCWSFTALPLIGPAEVDTNAAAHYVLTIHKSPGPGIDYKSAIKLPNTARPDRPTAGDLWSSDVQEEPDFNSRSVAANERQRIESALTAAAASPVLFDKDKDVIKPGPRAALGAFADALKAKNPSDPPIPLNLESFASSEGDVTHNTGLAERRGNAVRDILVTLGVPQPIAVTNRGPVGTPDDAANRKVDIAVDRTFETTYASNRYSVAEHEFGHLLGLPDEYQNNTTGRLGTAQTNYMALVTGAGVQGPAVWGVHTSSVMSAGVDVLPRHYVTLWEALGRMTAPDIAQNEWEIT
jgi:outer membrane protein OmpA-like peptidoglycan-associated protein